MKSKSRSLSDIKKTLTAQVTAADLDKVFGTPSKKKKGKGKKGRRESVDNGGRFDSHQYVTSTPLIIASQTHTTLQGPHRPPKDNGSPRPRWSMV